MQQPIKPQTAVHKPLPSDDMAEDAAIGSVFLDREAALDVPFLDPAMFYSQKKGWIWEAIQHCVSKRIAPDYVNVSNRLREQGRLEEIGGPAYLIQLSNSTPTASHVVYYAEIIERASVRRELIKAGGQIAALGYDEDDDDLDRVLDLAEQKIHRLRRKKKRGGLQRLRGAIERMYERIARKIAGETDLTRIATGYIDLDHLLSGGLRRSDLILLAARPSVGKSALGLSICYNILEAGLEPDECIAFFAMEMNADQLLERLLAMETTINSRDISSLEFIDHEGKHHTIMEALGKLDDSQLYVSDEMGQTILQLRAEARLLARDKSIRLVVVDYLQLMKGISKKAEGNREREISEISIGLKEMARELDVPVVALVQLNREIEKSKDKTFKLEYLRESGSLEQDADVVIGIQRPEMWDPDNIEVKSLGELTVAKHRGGPTGMVALRYHAQTTRFENIERYRVPEGY